MPTIGDYSEVSICNLALTEIGRSSQIASIDEQSTSARLCKQRYPYARDAVLRAYDWNFAAARVELDALSGSPVFEYSKAFTLPDDCLRVRSIYGGERCKWKVEKRQILANWTGKLPLIYTALITDTTEFDPLFVAALASYIAADICIALTESTTRQQGLWQSYRMKMTEARMRDGQEDTPDDLPVGSWVESRYY
jgi:hypothetical protein